MVDTAVTQELIVETKSYQGKNETQETVDDTAVTQELAVETEADHGEKETITQKSIDDAAITHESTAEMEQFHPWEDVTHSIFSACGRTLGPSEGWGSERMC